MNAVRAISSCFSEVWRVLKPGGCFLSLSFTDRTWGYGLGAQGEDAGSVRAVAAGPLLGMGYVQFLSRADLDRLYAGFVDHVIERNSYTMGGQQHLIEQWVVVCRKPEH